MINLLLGYMPNEYQTQTKTTPFPLSAKILDCALTALTFLSAAVAVAAFTSVTINPVVIGTLAIVGAAVAIIALVHLYINKKNEQAAITQEKAAIDSELRQILDTQKDSLDLRIKIINLIDNKYITEEQSGLLKNKLKNLQLILSSSIHKMLETNKFSKEISDSIIEILNQKIADDEIRKQLAMHLFNLIRDEKEVSTELIDSLMSMCQCKDLDQNGQIFLLAKSVEFLTGEVCRLKKAQGKFTRAESEEITLIKYNYDQINKLKESKKLRPEILDLFDSLIYYNLKNDIEELVEKIKS